MQGSGLNPNPRKKLEVKTVSDIVNQSKGNGGSDGCNGQNGPPCTSIGMKYGIVIGVF